MSRNRYSTHWDGIITATSSIAHAGDSRGTLTLLRRERILRDGVMVEVPVISGNSWRGRLRRMAEELLREELGYEGLIPFAAAHVLRGGGALTKSSKEPLSGARLREVRELVAPFAIFGGAAGRVHDGAIQVGKLIPHFAETQHLTGMPGPEALSATQLETFTRHREHATREFEDLVPASDSAEGTVDGGDEEQGPGPMLYRIETFPAGTTFSTWLHLGHVSDVHHAFFTDVLNRFSTAGHLGGRAGTGHGRFTADWTPRHTPEPADVDWRPWAIKRRNDIIDAIGALA